MYRAAKKAADRQSSKNAVGSKFKKVMGEYGSGSLKSSSGQKVTNPKQAKAIAYSEQRRAKKK